MRKIKKSSLAIAIVAIITLVMLPSTGRTAEDTHKRETLPAPAEDTHKRETFQATAMGQGTQFGRLISINVLIEEYSTADDQQALMEAFSTKGMRGLSNALGKMKSKGRLAITGTLGYDVTYIRSFQTATGRKIRLATNRAIRFGEAWADGRSMDYNLSALELDFNKDTGTSTGILLPACQFKIDKEKQLEIKAFQNPWKLQNIQER